MAGKKRISKKSKAGKKNPGVSWRPQMDVDWERWRRVGRGCGWLVALAVLAIAVVVGVPRLQAMASETGWRETTEVEFARAPAWIAGDLDTWLSRTVREQLSGDPFSREDLIAARAALAATGCFETVEQVRRIGTDLVLVDAAFIVPHAIVRDASGDTLIDRRGRLLPASYRPPDDHTFVTIVEPSFGRPVHPGQEWPGGDVTAALDIMRLVETRPWSHQIRAIDLRQFFTDEIIILISDRGTQIIWGAAPGREGAREVPPEQKLGYLDHNHREYMHVDRGCDRLDIMGAVVTCTN